MKRFLAALAFLLLATLPAQARFFAGAANNGSSASPTLTFTALANGSVSSTIVGSGTYTVAAPSSITVSAWTGTCTGTPTVSGFTAGSGVWSASFSTPSSACSGTLTVTGTGLNTATSGASPTATISSSTTEMPGPSAALFASPWYTCTRNFYVATTGSDSNAGTIGSPWLTIQHADSGSRTGGDCINVASGTYNADILIQNGGTGPTSTGYVAYRCQTLDACHVLAPGGGHLWGFEQPANFIVVDGFEVDGNNLTADTCIASDGATYGIGNSSHHIWALNNIVHDCNLGGIGFNNKEWIYIIHNEVYKNAWTSGFQGSGIGIVVAQCIETTAYDPTNGSHCASGATYAGGTGTYTPSGNDIAAFNAGAGIYTPFHNVVAWNDVHNNRLATTANGVGGVPCGSITDGNGIILDTWLDETTLTLNFPYQSLTYENDSYYNGGRGIHVFATNGITVANNSLWNNGTDQCLPAFPGVADLSLAGATNAFVINNNIKTAVTVAFAAPVTVTASNASLAVTNTYIATTEVTLLASGSMPGGFTSGNPYFVIAAGLSGSAVELSATSGGAAITPSSTGSGVTMMPFGCVGGGVSFCGGGNNSIIAGNGRGITSVNNTELGNVVDGTVTLFDNDATTASATAAIVGTVMTVSGTVTGTYLIGQGLSGTGVPFGDYIVSLGTGTGGAGTYNLSINQSVIATTISAGGVIGASNKLSTDPLYISASTGTMPTANGPPATFTTGNHNFALQSGSPAIGYAQSETYLPGVTWAGACNPSLTTCP